MEAVRTPLSPLVANWGASSARTPKAAEFKRKKEGKGAGAKDKGPKDQLAVQALKLATAPLLRPRLAFGIASFAC